MMYYRVMAKCGHVRRNHYIIKNFYVKANDGKEAAAKVRSLPRVKHHWKDAIVEVNEIDEEEYLSGMRTTNEDMYFKVNNSSKQRMVLCVDYDEVYEREYSEPKRKDKFLYYYVTMDKILRRDVKIQLMEGI